MGCALNLDSNYENQRDWSFFEDKHRTEYEYNLDRQVVKVQKPIGQVLFNYHQQTGY